MKQKVHSLFNLKILSLLKEFLRQKDKRKLIGFVLLQHKFQVLISPELYQLANLQGFFFFKFGWGSHYSYDWRVQ